jgi:hypothetical protein
MKANKANQATVSKIHPLLIKINELYEKVLPYIRHNLPGVSFELDERGLTKSKDALLSLAKLLFMNQLEYYYSDLVKIADSYNIPVSDDFRKKLKPKKVITKHISEQRQEDKKEYVDLSTIAWKAEQYYNPERQLLTNLYDRIHQLELSDNDVS